MDWSSARATTGGVRGYWCSQRSTEEAVALEALRVYPPIYAIARLVVESCDVGGQRLQPGTTVVISQARPAG
jgi:cytochrome P450